jgi:CheY-like chemotaxis protein
VKQLIRVVVAHEADAIREAAMRVVRDVGYQAIGVAEGESAHVLLLSSPHPAALVVDVGLPRRLGYELVEDIRRAELPTRTILIASVYSKTAYKRRPSSLYGADDYVEQHHIPDQLAPKLVRLVPPLGGAPSRLCRSGGAEGHEAPLIDVHDPYHLTQEQRAELAQIRAAGEGRLAFPHTTREESFERARRLARLIVADVILYNGAAVEAGLERGDLADRIAADLYAGRELFAKRVPPEIAADRDFIGAALTEFIASRGGRP